MKKRTKICVFAALCVLVLAVGLLTGCSNGEDKKDQDAVEPPIENQLPEVPEQNVTEPESPEDSEKEPETEDSQKEPDETENPAEGEKDNNGGEEQPSQGNEKDDNAGGEESETLKEGLEEQAKE